MSANRIPMTFDDVDQLRKAIDRCYPEGFQVGHTYGHHGWILQLRRRSGGPKDPKAPLFAGPPVWIHGWDEWPEGAAEVGIDVHLVEQMGGPSAPPRPIPWRDPPSAEPVGSANRPEGGLS